MCSLVEAVGRVADTTVKTGQPLKHKHVRRDVLISRGDRVIVRCLVGGVVISMEAEAKDDGAEGERIELRKLGERDTFFGTVTGRGAAIINMSRS
jgi:flagella basal body P-ring formation protein FlgA